MYNCVAMNVEILTAVNFSSCHGTRGSDSLIPSGLLQVQMKTQLCMFQE
jgi:hypothetical protein